LNRQYLLKKIGQPSPAPALVKYEQSAYDIVKRIREKHLKSAKYYDAIAADFNYQDTRAVAAALWDFCKNNIRYKEESAELQTVSAPQTILKNGQCDCKGYAMFIGGVLDALNRHGRRINWHYRFVSYRLLDETPGHVFTVIDMPDDTEIWVDPVLGEFDEHRPYFHKKDVRVRVTGSPEKIGCACSEKKIGAAAIGTGQATGQVIMKVAPVLAYVPVVGWIAAAAGEVIGFFLVCFGSKYTESTGVRWLTSFYEDKVLNLGKHSDNKVNQANIVASQNWFAAVTGVPIYDKYRIHALMGTDPEGTKNLGLTQEQRANKYLGFWDAKKAGVTYPQALAAVQRVDALNMKWTDPGGAWHDFTAAPATIDNSGNATTTGTINANTPTSQLVVNASGQLTTVGDTAAVAAATAQKRILILAAAAAAAIFIL
jgi:hypothetical protein